MTFLKVLLAAALFAPAVGFAGEKMSIEEMKQQIIQSIPGASQIDWSKVHEGMLCSDLEKFLADNFIAVSSTTGEPIKIGDVVDCK